MAETACTMCNSPTSRVIYCGLPMRLCDDRHCNGIYGWWQWVVGMIPEPSDGFTFVRFEGPYLAALWHWLRGGKS